MAIAPNRNALLFQFQLANLILHKFNLIRLRKIAMKKSHFILPLSVALTLLTTAGAALAQSVSVWSVDVHSKIFGDSAPGSESAVALSAASNEYESGQIGLRADDEVNNLEIVPSPLVCKETGTEIKAENVRIRRIGTLTVTKNTPNTESICVRKAPFEAPDILYDENVVSLKPGESQGVWITLFVPKGTPGGLYSGVIEIKNETVQKEIPVSLTVFPFELPDARSFYMTNWWSGGNFAKYHNVEYMSEEYWTLLEAYIKDMGEHRQNVILAQWVPSANDLVRAKRDENGNWEFDFSRFERLLQLAEKYGVADRIELAHVGGIDRQTHQVNFRSATVADKDGNNVSLSADEWLEPSLKAICDYLKKTGRLDRAMVHVADEPYLPDIDSWRAASQRVRDIAPDLKQIDAIETVNFSGRLDVWTPKLSHFDRWRKAFEARRGDGEFWYYICCHPVGPHYPNRFMDLPSSRIRVLHWINYAEDLVGYLHWGYNYWRDDAFGPPTETYGPGDTHIVYPGPNGPLDSIRWELERESAEDFEYLKLLETSVSKFKNELDPERAWMIDPTGRSKELARKVVPDLVHTELDGCKIEQVRQELADEIVAATGDLRLVVQTFPEDGKEIFSGPNLLEVYGVATPGAEVSINGEKVEVDGDGYFKRLFYPQELGAMSVVITATLDGKTVKTSRNYTIK